MTKPRLRVPVSSGYHYEKLNASVREIRLLNLLKKGRMGDPVGCALGTISLDDQQVPAYYALSYVWGSAADTREMTLENHAFSITANLHTALCFMRGSESDVLIWTDAVCINQDDIDERGRQVALMGDIYIAAEACACSGWGVRMARALSRLGVSLTCIR